MGIARTAVWTLALLLIIAGCNSTKPATLVEGNKAQIPVTITGLPNNFTACYMHALPSGTIVTILDENSPGSTVKFRIEQGEFKGQEAIVAGNAIRRTE
jgi:hypothetical protein